MRDQGVLRNLLRRWNGTVGLVVTCAFVLVAIIGPFLVGTEALQQSGAALAGPSGTHWMGTDELGRDIFSRVIVGLRASMEVGVGAVFIAAIVGTATGVVAGYFGGWLEALVMRTWDAVLAFPAIFFALGLVAVLGASERSILIALVIVNMPIFARLARAATLGETKKQYVDAARTVGLSRGTIMFGEILPNIAAPLLVSTATAAPRAIIVEASLSFLGMGAQPPAPSLGQTIASSRVFLLQDPWYGMLPGLVLVVLVLALSLLGTSLPDALDPARRLRMSRL